MSWSSQRKEGRKEGSGRREGGNGSGRERRSGERANGPPGISYYGMTGEINGWVAS